ncbi:MAG: zinc ribbon domain-containing protein [Endomicrobiia bacterium]
MNFKEFLKKIKKYREQGMFDIERYPKSKDCLDDELICAYVDGNVTEEEKRKVLEHINNCRRCMFEIADLVKIKNYEIKDEELKFDTKFVVRKCFHCEKINLHKEKYCKYCGKVLPGLLKIFCPDCENPVREESKYCPHCGVSLNKKSDDVINQINNVTKSLLKKG